MVGTRVSECVAGLLRWPSLQLSREKAKGPTDSWKERVVYQTLHRETEALVKEAKLYLCKHRSASLLQEGNPHGTTYIFILVTLG
jgi:hypothetical protein